jgi:hypothetical protein
LADWLTYRWLSGLSLVLAFVTMMLGVLMFLSRVGAGGVRLNIHAPIVLERSLLMAAVVLTAIGFILLENVLSQSAVHGLARIGATLYLIATPILLTSEAIELAPGRGIYYLYVIYVVLALLAHAVIGFALFHTTDVPMWIGALTFLWGLGWLIALPIVSPRDMYYPILQHLMPLIIGIALLTTKGSS